MSSVLETATTRTAAFADFLTSRSSVPIQQLARGRGDGSTLEPLETGRAHASKLPIYRPATHATQNSRIRTTNPKAGVFYAYKQPKSAEAPSSYSHIFLTQNYATPRPQTFDPKPQSFPSDMKALCDPTLLLPCPPAQHPHAQLRLG